jgi:hypothetical protein
MRGEGGRVILKSGEPEHSVQLQMLLLSFWFIYMRQFELLEHYSRKFVLQPDRFLEL